MQMAGTRAVAKYHLSKVRKPRQFKHHRASPHVAKGTDKGGNLGFVEMES